MKTMSCPVFVKCPIFEDMLKDQTTITYYQRKYCYAGEACYEKCLRYKVFNIIGTCPSQVMPDDKHTPEEVLLHMKTEYDKGLAIT